MVLPHPDGAQLDLTIYPHQCPEDEVAKSVHDALNRLRDHLSADMRQVSSRAASGRP